MSRRRAPLNSVKVLWVERRQSYYLRWRDPDTERWVEQSCNTRTRREADRAAGRKSDELLTRTTKPVGSTSWAEFKVAFIQQHLPSLAERTTGGYITALDCYEQRMKPPNLAAITAPRIAQWLSGLRDGNRSESTIEGYSRHLKSALRWAANLGWIDQVPRFPAIVRAKTGSRRLMKGRPLTDTEFAAMLAAVPAVVGADRAEPWTFLLRGLWLSGLRLSEALSLSWDEPREIRVDLTGPRPMLRIPAEREKGRQDRLLPLAPEFAELLTTVTPEHQVGRVFAFARERQRVAPPSIGWVSRLICRVGQRAGIEVASGKWASAHDLRRSFGTRWARRVLPQILQQLMRHSSIATTMRYYVELDAESTAADVWQAFEAGREKSGGRSGGQS
jgi:integrase